MEEETQIQIQMASGTGGLPSSIKKMDANFEARQKEEREEGGGAAENNLDLSIL